MDEKLQKTDEPTEESGPACEVFFDGDCPLCRAEIGLYQRGGSDARFTNVAENGSAPDGITQAEALARFHVRKADGTLVSGAAAFAELWKATPGWRWLGHVAGTPPLVWLAEGAYRLFLLIRPSIQKAVRRAS